MDNTNSPTARRIQKPIQRNHKPLIGASILSLLALAIFAFSGLQHSVTSPPTASAALGDAGNVKAVLTNELGAVVTGGTIAIVCDGTPLSFADNGARDLDATVGTIEVTPTGGDLITTGCFTNGEALHITFSSTDGTLVTKTVDSTLTLTSANQVVIPTIQFPLSVTLKDAFGADITPDTITYNGAAPTATSGATSYWASTAGSGALVVTKAGYVNASATNTGLSSVSVGTSDKTSVTFGNASAVSTSVSAGSAITVQGLAPTVKFVLTNSGSALDLSQATVEKSTNSGTTYTSLTPSNITSNVGYDAASPAAGNTLYRINLNGYQELITEAFTPVASTQTSLNLALSGLGKAPSSSSRSQAAVAPLTIILATPNLPPSDTTTLLATPDSTTLPIPLVTPPPTLTIPAPTALSSTSIQWNLPKDIPQLPAVVLLSKIEGEGTTRHLTLIESKVVTAQTNDWFILESGLTSGTEYGNRVLNIDGVSGAWAFPTTKTFSQEPPRLEQAPVSSSSGLKLLFPKADNVAPQQSLAIHVLEIDEYVQADGSLYADPAWRPWYKWGFVPVIEGRNNLQNRLLRIEGLPEGQHTIVVEVQQQDSQLVIAGPPLSVNVSDQKVP